MIWSKVRKLAAGLAALGAAGCATVPAAEATGDGPALWSVADEDTTIYLFGTIHLLPKGHEWRTPLIDRAIAAADELVIETVIDDPMAQAQQMKALGTSPGLPPIAERVPEDKRDELKAAIAASGAPEAAFDRLETWAAGLALASASFRSMGLEPSLGVEKSLEAAVKARARPVIGLETVEEQLGYLDRLPEEAQREFLLSVLQDPEEARRAFAAMLATWSRGDVDGIARTFDTELKETPELRDALLRRRNANWAEWIDERLDRPGTVMVAVGAGHLAGPDSLQQMLRSRGIEVRRLQ